jgi:hypothetical protein
MYPMPIKHVPKLISLEDSWKFLTSIAEAVIYRFSKKDQDLLLALGTVLCKIGMIYHHVIEYGVRHDQISGKSETLAKQKS